MHGLDKLEQQSNLYQHVWKPNLYIYLYQQLHINTKDVFLQSLLQMPSRKVISRQISITLQMPETGIKYKVLQANMLQFSVQPQRKKVEFINLNYYIKGIKFVFVAEAWDFKLSMQARFS